MNALSSIYNFEYGSYPRYTHIHYVSTLLYHRNTCNGCEQCSDIIRDEIKYLHLELEKLVTQFNFDVLENNNCNHSLIENIGIITRILKQLK